eukprot:364743-Chlamydomonas_euryale.AAC.25
MRLADCVLHAPVSTVSSTTHSPLSSSMSHETLPGATTMTSPGTRSALDRGRRITLVRPERFVFATSACQGKPGSRDGQGVVSWEQVLPRG